MKQPSSYLKMRVLGAIESAPGKTQQERVENVAQMVFIDEYGEKGNLPGGPYTHGITATKIMVSPP